METEQIVLLDPAVILADDNIRYSLKADRVDALAEQIRDLGMITTPLWVEPLDDNSYRLTAGNYRKAAVEKLNKEGAGLLLPCIVRPTGDSLNRLKQQLSENKDRENLSPMDKAIAIKKLLDAGVPRLEIRKIFSTPGGRKGARMQPASNSYINMHVSFLDFPAKIREKIHAGADGGGLGLAAAYELTKCSREKWDAVLERAEADRTKQLEQEEKDEKRYLETERKEAEARDKTIKLEQELAAAKIKLEEMSQEVSAKAEVATAAYKAAKEAKEAEAKKAAEEKLKAIEEEAKAAEKAAAETRKTVEKLEGKVESAAKLAQEKAKKLKEMRAASAKGKPKGAAPGPKEIKKAAQAEGATTNYVPLNATEMRRVVEELATLPGTAPKVQAIFKAIHDCFRGVTTDKQMYMACQRATGEKK